MQILHRLLLFFYWIQFEASKLPSLFLFLFVPSHWQHLVYIRKPSFSISLPLHTFSTQVLHSIIHLRARYHWIETSCSYRSFFFLNITLSISSLPHLFSLQSTFFYFHWQVLYTFTRPVPHDRFIHHCCLNRCERCPQPQLHARCYTEKIHSEKSVFFLKTNMAQFKNWIR